MRMDHLITDGYNINQLYNVNTEVILNCIFRPYYKIGDQRIHVDDFRCTVVDVANQKAIVPTRLFSVNEYSVETLALTGEFFDFGLFVEIDGSEIDLSEWEQPVPWLTVKANDTNPTLS